MQTDVILQGDCLQVMRDIPSGSVDLVLTDPPYFKVMNEAWDRQWDNPAKFLEWIGILCEAWYRVLKPNGSLYVFASPQMSARVECKIAERFNILNSIVWRKAMNRSGMAEKEALRVFFPITERIIFAEHYGADNIAKGEAGYVAKCDDLRGFIFEPLRAYLASERDRLGIKNSDIVNQWQAERGNKGGMTSHWFSQSQWELPTEKNYEWLRKLFNQNGGEYLSRQYEELRLQYEELRLQYEELRLQYEELRRVFNVTKDVPYTDVWDFPAEPAGDNDRHPCQKPLGLIKHMIAASSKPDGVVLDCFLGSGTTAVACIQTGRHYIGIEQSEEYCRIAERRVANAVQQLTLL